MTTGQLLFVLWFVLSLACIVAGAILAQNRFERKLDDKEDRP